MILSLILVGFCYGDNFSPSPLEGEFRECPDAEAGLNCQRHCFDIFEDCRLHCNGEADCLVNCGTESNDCLYGCPCYGGCPDGCQGCASSFCKCVGELEDIPEYVLCEKYFNDRYFECLLGCPIEDTTCLGECARVHGIQIETCPCKPGCPAGCPCQSYQCPGEVETTTSSTTSLATTTEPAHTSLLVLYSNGERVPLVLHVDGGSRQPNFSLGHDTEVYRSCSLVFQGVFYVYGGWYIYNQISRVNGCELERVGTLPFDLRFGGCAIDNNDRIYLCFNFKDEEDFNLCHLSSNPTSDFETMVRSNYNHDRTKIAASDSFLFAVGSGYHTRAELYDINSGKWKSTAEYPYGSKIYLAPNINVGKYFYLFGGYTGSDTSTIARFDSINQSWQKIGDLNQARRETGMIIMNDQFLVVGGVGNFFTEKCILNKDDRITCQTQEPSLDGYWSPEMMSVPDNFCT